jgi:hypothetical protein
VIRLWRRRPRLGHAPKAIGETTAKLGCGCRRVVPGDRSKGDSGWCVLHGHQPIARVL